MISDCPHRRRVPLLAAVLALVVVVTGGRLSAHEGPEHEIEELTALIEGRGETVELLLERAIEYGVLGRYSEATRDLEHAVRLDPASVHALRELSRYQHLAGRTNEALATITRALEAPRGEAAETGGLHLQRAEFLRAAGRYRPALDDCHAAIRLHPLNPEWYLFRSDLQRRLGVRRQRIADLQEGIRRTEAGVLTFELVEALLDAGRFREALKQIEPELDSSRLRSRWLVRRGRALIGLGRRAEAEPDLRAALKEIDERLDPARPDASLLLDQATALVLLGERDAARHALELARTRGGDAGVTERMEQLLRSASR